MLSLTVATTLSSMSISDAMSLIKALDGNSTPAQWEKAESAALQLATHTMPCLSGGFSPIVMCVFGCGWGGSILMFCEGLMGRSGPLIGASMAAMMPVAAAWTIAGTSTQCAHLMDQLNKQRMMNLRSHERLTALETALRQQNNGKGLGFTVQGILLDHRMLSQIGLAIVSIFSTIIPGVLLLRYQTVNDCSLSDTQVSRQTGCGHSKHLKIICCNHLSNL